MVAVMKSVFVEVICWLRDIALAFAAIGVLFYILFLIYGLPTGG